LPQGTCSTPSGSVLVSYMDRSSPVARSMASIRPVSRTG
jgi:hypothetical protein